MPVDLLNQAVEHTSAKAIQIHADQCLAVRHRLSSCRACVEACPAQAITRQGNLLDVDRLLCLDCGACTVACPTEALTMAGCDPEQLSDRVDETLSRADDIAIIACSSMVSKSGADRLKLVEVPCLGWVDEGVLVDAAAFGACKIVLVDAGCDTCEFGGCEPSIDSCVAAARSLLDACGSPVLVKRSGKFPSVARPDQILDDGSRGRLRRRFLGRAANGAAQTALSAFKISPDKQKDEPASRAATFKALRATGDALPYVRGARRERKLAALASLVDEAESLDGALFSVRDFAHVDIDTDACIGCGMCQMFCPTGALKMDEDGDSKRLVFSAFQCIGCDMCQDVCFRKCVTVLPEVPVADVFSGQPRSFELNPEIGRQPNKAFGMGAGSVAHAVLGVSEGKKS